MEANEKKTLFTAVSEEECATVCGGDSLLSDVLNSIFNVNSATSGLISKVSKTIGPDGANVTGDSSAALTPTGTLVKYSAGTGAVLIVNLLPTVSI